jgi:hypothetical protein
MAVVLLCWMGGFNTMPEDDQIIHNAHTESNFEPSELVLPAQVLSVLAIVGLVPM